MMVTAHAAEVLGDLRPAADDEVRQIEVGENPTRYARGWHCLGLAETFRDGKPHSIEVFGGKIVIWQDTKGELNALELVLPAHGRGPVAGHREGR